MTKQFLVVFQTGIFLFKFVYSVAHPPFFKHCLFHSIFNLLLINDLGNKQLVKFRLRARQFRSVWNAQFIH